MISLSHMNSVTGGQEISLPPSYAEGVKDRNLVVRSVLGDDWGRS